MKKNSISNFLVAKCFWSAELKILSGTIKYCRISATFGWCNLKFPTVKRAWYSAKNCWIHYYLSLAVESVQVFISAVGKQTETFVLCNIYSYVQVPTHELDVKVFCFFFFPFITLCNLCVLVCIMTILSFV